MRMIIKNLKGIWSCLNHTMNAVVEAEEKINFVVKLTKMNKDKHELKTKFEVILKGCEPIYKLAGDYIIESN